ncbi:N-acetylmuramoyl-L-alanine amidase [Magnetovibrio sp. PR-2]|uniref:N-acetylmuramoyl-L-alanine amidase n=1 Tax=Magnetovibrio sp. PR-2 TaxID=3120356 RepID=UPI002FCE3B0E
MSTPRVSPNFNDRPPDVPIDMLVLHYTGMQSANAALDRLCDAEAEVSAHYLIEEDGTVHRLVDEDKRAWHAGVSWWRGATDVNSRSIGIELVNPGHEFGYRAFLEPQMVALEGLAGAILKRHAIPGRNVVGHSDVAPLRKTDPGELFDWARLAQKGIGLWAQDSVLVDASAAEFKAMLLAFGYDTSDFNAAIVAFQRHFRPARLTTAIEPDCVGVLQALLDQV